ncbi:MAG: Lrp/AsnC family transcriptional regulator [Desulfamplus sp.]|nr:Lrp/AsnC family transcriptional regulator [Desulfamplus sp.]
MDDTDLRILKILQEKARIPNVEISRNIGMAPSAVLERIKKLESKGIISGYEIRLNPECFNHSMVAFIQVRLNLPAKIEQIVEKLSCHEEIQEIHYISGEDSLLLKVRISNGAELQTIINEKIATIKGVQSTKSFIALSTYKESARFPIPNPERQV